jgi:hypothetical protein
MPEVEAPALARCQRCDHLEVAHSRVAPRPCCEPVVAEPDARGEINGEYVIVDCPCGALVEAERCGHVDPSGQDRHCPCVDPIEEDRNA